MAVNKRAGFGVTLSVDPTGGTSYTTLAAIVDGVSESDAKATTVDTTLLSETFMTNTKTQIDPGEVTFTIAYDPDETTSVLLKALHTSVNPVPPAWLITYPYGVLGSGSITTKGFFAHLTGLSREQKKDGMIVQNVTLKKTGNPGF